MYNRAGILKAGRKVVRGVQITFWRVCGWIFFGALYGGLETLWRGHTHWTMLVLAAVISIPLDIANDTVIPWETPLWLQAMKSNITMAGRDNATHSIQYARQTWPKMLNTIPE